MLDYSTFLTGASASNTTTPGDGPCNVGCVLKEVTKFALMSPTLLGVIFVLLTTACFLSARAARVSRELREAKRELSIALIEKKKAIRYANLEL